MPKKCIRPHQCYRVMKSAGAREVSDEASFELQEIIEKIALDISKRAIEFAYDDSRWKVTRDDVKKGFEELLKGFRWNEH